MRLSVWMVPALGGVMLLTLIVLTQIAPDTVYVAPTTAVVATTSAASPTKPEVKPVATSTPKTVAKPAAKPLVVQVAATAPEVVNPPAVTQGALDAGSTNLRGALVNIICNSHSTAFNSISGSGVMIDPKGIILTNAHIALYFLFQGDTHYPVSCVIRRGSPAVDAYHAKLVFISPAWVAKNADILGKSRPIGNGEHDLALIAVTDSATSAPLPSSYPALPLSFGDTYPGEPVIIGSYGAQFLSSDEIRASLFPTIVFGSIKMVYTYTDTSIDVISLGGSAAAQQGSSGGGVVDGAGELVGTIVTSTVEGETSERNLSAITSSYVVRDYLSEMGTPLTVALDRPINSLINDFAPQISALRSLITAHIP